MNNCTQEKICKKSIPSSCSVCPTNPVARIVYGWGSGNNQLNVTNARQNKKGGWTFEINGLKSSQDKSLPLLQLLNNYFKF